MNDIHIQTSIVVISERIQKIRDHPDFGKYGSIETVFRKIEDLETDLMVSSYSIQETRNVKFLLVFFLTILDRKGHWVITTEFGILKTTGSISEWIGYFVRSKCISMDLWRYRKSANHFDNWIRFVAKFLNWNMQFTYHLLFWMQRSVVSLFVLMKFSVNCSSWKRMYSTIFEENIADKLFTFHFANC